MIGSLSSSPLFYGKFAKYFMAGGLPSIFMSSLPSISRWIVLFYGMWVAKYFMAGGVPSISRWNEVLYGRWVAKGIF